MKYNIVFDQRELEAAHLESAQDLLMFARSLGLKNFNETMLIKFKVANADIDPKDVPKVKANKLIVSIEEEQKKYAL